MPYEPLLFCRASMQTNSHMSYRQRAQKHAQPVYKVLEIAAGDGRLGFYLSQELCSRQAGNQSGALPAIQLICTDSGQYNCRRPSSLPCRYAA